jgi:hypothetical protein
MNKARMRLNSLLASRLSLSTLDEWSYVHIAREAWRISHGNHNNVVSSIHARLPNKGAVWQW